MDLEGKKKKTKLFSYPSTCKINECRIMNVY